MRRSKIFLISSVSLLAGGIQGNVLGFEPIGGIWPNSVQNPVLYKVNKSSAPPEFQSAVIAAFNAWNEAAKKANADIAFKFAGSTNAIWGDDRINVVSWDSSPPDHPRFIVFHDASITDISPITVPQGDPITDTDITFNGEWSFSVDDTTYPGSESTQVLPFEAVILHEVGHIVGLKHVFPSSPSVMVEGNRSLTLFQDDVDGIGFLYDSTPPFLVINLRTVSVYERCQALYL